jgi:hypothetical protein
MTSTLAETAWQQADHQGKGTAEVSLDLGGSIRGQLQRVGENLVFLRDLEGSGEPSTPRARSVRRQPVNLDLGAIGYHDADRLKHHSQLKTEEVAHHPLSVALLTGWPGGETSIGLLPMSIDSETSAIP